MLPKFTDAKCDMTCIKQLVAMPCDYCCQVSAEAIKPIKLERPYKSDSQLVQQSEEFVLKTCRSCALLRQGELPDTEEIMCDCFPNVGDPSLSQIRQLGDYLVLEAKQSNILNKSLSEFLPKPKAKPVPLHFARNSQEMLRQSIDMKKLAMRDVKESKKRRSTIMETKVKPIKFDSDTTIKTLKAPAKIADAKDSFEIFRKNSELSGVEKRWAKYGKISASNSVSTIVEYRNFGLLSTYLDKIKRASIISSHYHSTPKTKTSSDVALKVKLTKSESKKSNLFMYGKLI